MGKFSVQRRQCVIRRTAVVGVHVRAGAAADGRAAVSLKQTPGCCIRQAANAKPFALRGKPPRAWARGVIVAELRRNADLRALGGLEHAGQVPHAWNLSRFLGVLGQEPFRPRWQKRFHAMVQRLGRAVPSLEEYTPGDATHLSAGGVGGPDPHAAAAGQGRKEYTNEAGHVTRVVEWFGYKLHLVCNTRHEVALAYTVTPASRPDHESLPELVRPAKANWPPQRSDTLAYDKAGDDEGGCIGGWPPKGSGR